MGTSEYRNLSAISDTKQICRYYLDMDSFFSMAVRLCPPPAVVNAGKVVISSPKHSVLRKWTHVDMCTGLDVDVVEVTTRQRLEFHGIMEVILAAVRRLGFKTNITCVDTILFWGDVVDLADMEHVLEKVAGLPLTIGCGRTFDEAKRLCNLIKESKYG